MLQFQGWASSDTINLTSILDSMLGDGAIPTMRRMNTRILCYIMELLLAGFLSSLVSKRISFSRLQEARYVRFIK